MSPETPACADQRPEDLGLTVGVGEALAPGLVLRRASATLDAPGAVLELDAQGVTVRLLCRPTEDMPKRLAAGASVAVTALTAVNHELAQRIRAAVPALQGLRFRAVTSRRRLRVEGPAVTWDDALDQMPGSLKIADHCDEDCAFCSSQRADHPGGAMPDPEAVRARIRRWAAEGLRGLQFVDREPTLNPRLAEYIAYARAQGFREVRVNSNGVRLGEGTLLRECVDAGMTELCVSLHTADPELSDAMTARVGGHARKLEAIRRALTMPVRLVVNAVVTRDNVAELPRLVTLMNGLGETGRTPHVVLSLVGPVGAGAARPDLLPRYADVAPSLQAAFDRAYDLVVHPGYALPPCVLEPAYRTHLRLTQRDDRSPLPGRAYAARCDGCVEVGRCPGVWEPYLRQHGDAELRPISRG